ncbi:GNAT family N-acetyltransferase [Frondihabitans cladoniiphilus]|uniref:GNAT family N-acetyltransferase n=1 Tax=Frondihabitans cladoniiphilus TaxID=715785 RepID=A0ABP8W1E1_9MICO
MASFDDDYDLRTFDPALVDGVPDDRTRDWLAATRIAFHQSNSDAAVLEGALGAIDDGRVFTGVYAKEPLPGSLAETWPVGTYTGYTKTIDVGGGILVDSYLISDVTVRPTHKRRGMLRHLMTDRLAAAAADGLALAALTASESTIYRRFGFGPAVRNRSVRLRRDRPFGLHVKPAGRVELADAASLGTVARAVFAGYHARTPGSVDRQKQFWDRVLGLKTDEGKPDESVRAAVHYAPTAEGEAPGAIDGYVTYRMKEEGRLSVLEVVDLVGADANAYLGLWNFLGRVDLVDAIEYRHGAVDTALLHALVDSRTLETTREADHIWLRVLDPITALSARPYALDGSLVLRIHDDLGYCEGTFTLAVEGGTGTLTETGDALPDLELDAATLASLYLGGVSAGVLAEAGLIVAHADGAVARASALFAPDRPVDCITDF